MVLVLGPYCILYYKIGENQNILFVNDDPDRIYHLRPVNFTSAPPSSDVRVTHLRETCRRLGLTGESLRSNTMHHILVDDRHRAMFCGVPSGAWTSWVTLLVNASGNTPEPAPQPSYHLPVHSRNYLRNHNVHPLEDYFPDEIRFRLDTYFTFIVVRHPLKRQVSNFISKMDIDQMEADRKWNTLQQDLLNQYRNRNNSNIGSMDIDVTFPEYLRYALDRFAQDRKWITYFAACQPCSIRYDYVAKVETMKRDSEAVFERMGLSSELWKLPHIRSLRTTNTRTGQVYMKYLQKLSDLEYRRLLSTYQVDMKLFQYEEPRFKN